MRAANSGGYIGGLRWLTRNRWACVLLFSCCFLSLGYEKQCVSTWDQDVGLLNGGGIDRVGRGAAWEFAVESCAWQTAGREEGLWNIKR